MIPPSDKTFRDMRAGATFDPSRTYRWTLWRGWDARKPTLAFVMLNPSVADEQVLDPTLRRCLRYAINWGYGTMLIGNLFALRSTDPRALYKHPDPVGSDNDAALMGIRQLAGKVIVAWGSHGNLNARGRHVAQLLGSDLWCLTLTKTGEPMHPLYLKANATPQPFSYALKADA